MIALRKRDERQLSETIMTGEFPFSMADFRAISRIAKAEAGIDLSESKSTLVYSRLTKRLRALGLATFADYCEAVRCDDAERTNMIAALTTNVTRFLRESHHFQHLRRHILEPLAEDIRNGRRVRLWSSACSTGQEPYSMALAVLSVIPNAAELDVRILATDLNPLVVAHGKKGQYPKSELSDLPRDLCARWFEAVPGEPSDLRVNDTARSLISFRELNLMGKWPISGPFDAIFCRNVVIYFDRDTQAKIWQRMSCLLGDGGALYIGHSERVAGPALQGFRVDGITTYRKKADVTA